MSEDEQRQRWGSALRWGGLPDRPAHIGLVACDSVHTTRTEIRCAMLWRAMCAYSESKMKRYQLIRVRVVALAGSLYSTVLYILLTPFPPC